MILIAAEHMKEQLTRDWFMDILLTQTSKEELRETLCNLVDSVPLAYDVDKTVERLETDKEEFLKSYKEFLDGEDYRMALLLEKAIAIIKEEMN